MCGKYTLMVEFMPDELHALLTQFMQNGEDWSSQVLSKGGEISPGDRAPALVLAGGKLQIQSMRWGLQGRAGRLIINARSETAHAKPMFSRMLSEGRCALPVAGYFEWRDSDGRKHLICPTEAPAMYLAGLYRMEADGELHFVVLTREAYGEHAAVHGRMPLILPTGSEARKWLSGAIRMESLAALRPELSIQPLGDEQMRMDLGEF